MKQEAATVHSMLPKVTALLAATLLCPAVAPGQVWSDEFATHSPDGGVHALLHHDDGAGRALYIGGEFTRAGLTPCRSVARWTADGWAPLGEGVEGRITDMASMTLDGRPALIVAGEITAAGGAPTEGLAAWMEGQWHAFSAASALGPGVSGVIDAIEVFDDGSGDLLVVGGEKLGLVGGLPITAFAAWDGREWTDLSAGLHSYHQLNLAVLELGGERSLYAAGSFGPDPLGFEWTGSVLRLDQEAWTPVNEDIHLSPFSGRPALAVFETSAGEGLYLASNDFFAFPHQWESLARWDGESWETISGVEPVQSPQLDGRAVLTEAPGLGLLLGGLAFFPQRHVMSYIGPDGALYEASLYDHAEHIMDAAPVELEPGRQETLLASAKPAGRLQAWNLVRYDGTTGRPITGAGPDGNLLELERGVGAWDDALFLGGSFSQVGQEPAPAFARLGASGLAGIDGLDHTWVQPMVLALHSTELDGAPAVIVGGHFDRAGPHDVAAIAAWTPAGWRALGEGFSTTGLPHSQRVSALATAPTAQGDWIIAAGSFTHSGAEPMRNIAAWDGERWRALGEGLASVNDVCWFDDGSGGAIYATSRDELPRFDGDRWETVATVSGGVAPRASSLAVWPGAGGPELILGGRFELAGGVAARNIAAWNGDSWRSVGDIGDAPRLHVLDSGAGPRLWATGQFFEVDGIPTDRIAVWDGATWEAVGVPGEQRDPVTAAEAMEWQGRSRVFVGGVFTELDGAPAGFLTYEVDGGCRADLDGDGILTFFDFLIFTNLYAAGDPRADFDGDGELTFFDFLAFSDEFSAGCV